VAHWDEFTTRFFDFAPYHEPVDPRDRLLAYVDFRKAILTGELLEFSCFAGTIVQEAYCTHPDISSACARNITAHAKILEGDVEAAMRRSDVRNEWSAEILALPI
jgi:TetR/AcrR family transcriptional repressor of nem operon